MRHPFIWPLILSWLFWLLSCSECLICLRRLASDFFVRFSVPARYTFAFAFCAGRHPPARSPPFGLGFVWVWFGFLGLIDGLLAVDQNQKQNERNPPRTPLTVGRTNSPTPSIPGWPTDTPPKGRVDR